jgi:hypothetical protein
VVHRAENAVHAAPREVLHIAFELVRSDRRVADRIADQRVAADLQGLDVGSEACDEVIARAVTLRVVEVGSPR